MKYLPVEGDLSAAYDVYTPEPVRVTYKRSCQHPGAPVAYRFMDKRSEHMGRFYGTCCKDCGRLLSKTKLD